LDVFPQEIVGDYVRFALPAPEVAPDLAHQLRLITRTLKPQAITFDIAPFNQECHRAPGPEVKRQFALFRIMINDLLGNSYSLPRQELSSFRTALPFRFERSLP
jgi:hypothetical protein